MASEPVKDNVVEEEKPEEEKPVQVVKEEGGEGPKLTREEEIEEALNCPCVDSMKEGPCGEVFLKAYRCFLESDEEPKGSDCYESFLEMHNCIESHPDDYKLNDEEDKEALRALETGGGPAEELGIAKSSQENSSEAPTAEPASQETTSPKPSSNDTGEETVS
ncbi:hypothetical protein NDN08_005472 [Rhodosorus marinus]|uniref:GCK domain-containing protein n=1 Tax=Rhodosorus marinus TaxID=101924 RepID=A0AAV8V4J9_9RHOD|nr:hypothetical protein NDN08_005472 [Rhodosorus marinus]